MDISIWIFERTERFPKNLRYSLAQKNGQPLFRDIGINCSNDLQFVKKGIFDKDKHKVGCIKNINPDGL